MALGLDDLGQVLQGIGDPFNIQGKTKIDILKKDQHVQLSRILEDSGWGPAASDSNRRARAVVKRESGGNPTATNPSGATGLFQMMTPLHCGSYGIPKDGCQDWLKNPYNNARAAKSLYDANGWTPWKSSGFIPPLPTAWDTHVTLKESSSPIGVATDAASDVIPDPLKDLTSGTVSLVKAFFDPSTYFRLGKGALGGTLIVFGVAGLIIIALKEPIKNGIKAGARGPVRGVAKAASAATVSKALPKV